MQARAQGRAAGLTLTAKRAEASLAPQHFPVPPAVTAIPAGRWQCQYLDEVGVEPSHEDALDQFLLLTVLVTHGRGHGTVGRG